MANSSIIKLSHPYLPLPVSSCLMEDALAKLTRGNISDIQNVHFLTDNVNLLFCNNYNKIMSGRSYSPNSSLVQNWWPCWSKLNCHPPVKIQICTARTTNCRAVTRRFPSRKGILHVCPLVVDSFLCLHPLCVFFSRTIPAFAISFRRQIWEGRTNSC
jgi:hypothetical protein